METEAKKESGMNKDEIIRMAREAGGDDWGIFKDFMPEIERFAALVAAAERERLKWDGIHSCHPECDRPACVNMRKAVEAEREACIDIAEQHATIEGIAQKIIADIRARGQQ